MGFDRFDLLAPAGGLFVLGASEAVRAGLLRLPPGAGPLVVVEPDPDRAAGIEVLARGRGQDPGPDLGLPDLRVRAGLPSEADPADLLAAPFTLYNEPDLRGRRPVSAAARALFPGLSPRRRLTPRPLSQDELAALAAALRPGFGIWIDLPGEERTVLRMLEAARILGRAGQVVLRCARVPFFTTGDDAATLVAWLAERGFLPAGQGGADPDWPVTVCVADPGRRETEAARRQAEAALGRLNGDLARAEAQAELGRRDLGEMRARWQAAEREGRAQAARLDQIVEGLRAALSDEGDEGQDGLARLEAALGIDATPDLATPEADGETGPKDGDPEDGDPEGGTGPDPAADPAAAGPEASR